MKLITNKCGNVKSTFKKKLDDRNSSRNRRVVKEIIELIKQEDGEIEKFVKENTSVEEDDA